MMDILIGLVPALGWGVEAIVMQKIGGKFTNKVMGMITGAVLFALVVFCFRRPAVIDRNLLVGSLLCGVFWSFGQLLQVKSFDMLGVSKAMPISTGGQLLGTALFGMFYFHEWTTPRQYVLGLTALAVIVFGIALTAGKTQQGPQAGGRGQLVGGLLALTASSLGLVGYAVIPRLFGLNGWDMLLPQALAMFVSTALLIALVKDNQMWGPKSWQNLATGACFAVANLTILLSNQQNGVVVGYTLSQLNVVVATLGGLFILHEKKTPKELAHVLCGLGLVFVGAVLIGLTKS